MKRLIIALACAGAAAAQDVQVETNIALFQRAKADMARFKGSYESATRQLDAHQYEDAIRSFDAVIASKSSRTDGALYWRAYALNKVGRRDEALNAIGSLRRDYPNSRWLADAQALEVEVKQGGGAAVSPASEANDDLKLMAINSLMNADPDRAIPLLEGLLKGNAAPKVKDRAMFVLTQNRSPRAQQVLSDYAKGAGNPDLQMQAIRYIGMSGTGEAQQQLASIYGSGSDVAVKREVLRALMVSRGRDQLFNLAKTEKDDSLRVEAIRQLGVMRAPELLAQLESGASPEVKVEIVRALFTAGAYDRLTEIAKNEKDVAVRSEAIRHLAMSRQMSGETIASFYTADTDARVKRELVNALQMRGDAKAMVDIARRENDPGMKKHIVSQLAGMRNNKEATDYMMELLK